MREHFINVVRMPDGKLIVTDGNHRFAVVKQLGEKSIPARVFDWFEMAPTMRVILKREFPETFKDDDIDPQ